VVKSRVYTPRKGDLKPKDIVTLGTQDVASTEAQEGELKPKDVAPKEAQKDDQKNRTV
jgi:hypothetical protein